MKYQNIKLKILNLKFEILKGLNKICIYNFEMQMKS